jgi:glycosyltransferase involved in cell wall biosynthesis
MNDPNRLPRLAYIGDVPVEASFAGSALLYRLLQRYPADRLRIIESDLFPARTDRQLPGVTYRTLRVRGKRLLTTRFHDWYWAWLLRRAAARAADARALLSDFDPQSIVTVGHGFAWIAAARFAEAARLPLHLIVHDDWPRVVSPRLRADVDAAFGRVYRQAASRLCVSPFMVDEYERRYGVRGTVMLPQRSPAEREFDGVAPRLRDQHRLVFAFAGTINNAGAAALLRTLAAVLAEHDAELSIFGPLTADVAAAEGLDLPNVTLRGLLPPAELPRRLRESADVLFVPMSFEPADQATMRVNFPSKLTEYTAVGLPILICGPEDSSAVRWARANAGVAEVVASGDRDALRHAVNRLASDQDLRVRLAELAQVIGRRDFDASTAERTFHGALVA